MTMCLKYGGAIKKVVGLLKLNKRHINKIFYNKLSIKSHAIFNNMTFLDG